MSQLVALKRSDLLIDEALAATYRSDTMVSNPFPDNTRRRKFVDELRASIVQSRRYFLDDDIVRAATTLGVQHPDILLAMLPRARLPVPKMWIEWNLRVALEETNATIADNAAPRVGVFLEQLNAADEPPLYRMTNAGVSTDGERTFCLSPTSVIFSLDKPIVETAPAVLSERSGLARITNLKKETIDLALLGTAYNLAIEADEDVDAATSAEMSEHRLKQCRALVSHASHQFSPMYPSYDEIASLPRRTFEQFERLCRNGVLETAGTWRFIVSVLALIQARDATENIQPPRNPGKRRFVGGKSIPYLQHVRIALKLPRTIILRDMINSVRDSLPRARHEVEGHWKVSRKRGDPNCDHVEVAETENRYRCAHCGRARWFQPSHMRGSSEIGFVRKDRVVMRRNSESAG